MLMVMLYIYISCLGRGDSCNKSVLIVFVAVTIVNDCKVVM